jgi:Tfp pilus assembly major pilin PilA
VRRFIKDQQGATLMEVMIAVGIIGIGLWALSAVIPLAAYGIHEGSHLSTATFLANQRLEQVRNARWERWEAVLPLPPLCGVLDYGVDNLGVSASSTAAPVGSCVGGGTTFPDESPVVPDENPVPNPNPYAGYTRTVRITSCEAGCNGIVNNDLRQVVVTVTYRPMTGIGLSAAGTAKASTVTMYVARR